MQAAVIETQPMKKGGPIKITKTNITITTFIKIFNSKAKD